MRVNHESREIVCSVGDLVYENTYRRIGVERGDGFRRMWIGQDIHSRRAELRAAEDPNYRAEVHVVHRVERQTVVTRPEPNLRSTTDKPAAA